MRRKRRLQGALVGIFLASMAACNDAAAPLVGSIEVTAFTAGVDFDVDGYSILIDDQPAAVIDANGSRIIEGVSAGSHVIRFDGVATNCTTDPGQRTITVSANQQSVVEFVVTCVVRNPGSLPRYGTLAINTETTGPEPDENGYRALVSNLAWVNHIFLSTDGTVEVNLQAGSRYNIALADIAPNCRLQTNVSPDRVVDIVADVVTEVTFTVTCSPTYPARLAAGWQFAFVRDGKIHLANSDGSGVVQLSDGPSDCDPSWSPDGQRLAFVRDCASMSSIYVMNADGSNPTRLANASPGGQPSWSPDGSRIAFTSRSQGSRGVLTVSSTDDGKAPLEVVNRPGYEVDPAWSPGGSIAFVSDWVMYDFAAEIFVTTPGAATATQLTNGFVRDWPHQLEYYQPAWSPDGSKLAVTQCPPAFNSCDHSEIAIMNADGSFITPLAATRGYANPTWSPDGSVIAFGSFGMISWVRPLTGERGFILDQGHSPAWRPHTGATRR